MEGVKGHSAYNHYDKDFNHGPPFHYPIPTTTSTEAILKEIATTTTESTRNLSDLATSIFTNTNSTANTTDTGTFTNGVLNNTLIDETLRSNATEDNVNITSIINDLYNTNDISTEIVQNVTEGGQVIVKTVRTSTEDVFKYITSTASDVIASTIKDDENIHSSEHDMHSDGLNTSYIIMGLLIAVLIIIAVSLFIIYMYYKRRNSAHISNQYHGQSSKEIPTSGTKDLSETVVYHSQSER